MAAPRSRVVALVAALAVAGGAFLLATPPDGGPRGAGHDPTARSAKRTQLVTQRRTAESARGEVGPDGPAPITGTGAALRRADPADDEALTRVNRELLLETRIADLEQAAALAEADGHAQRSVLMRRRVDALSRMLSETRAEREL